MRDLPERSIAETVGAIAAGEQSAVDLAQRYLDRIDTHDGALNVFRTVTHERALAEAATVDAAVRAGDALGPLAGIPIAIKDNIAVEGVELTAGTRTEPVASPGRTLPSPRRSARPAPCSSGS